MLAKVQAFGNESISEEGNTELSDFWKQCDADGAFEVLRQHTKNNDTYGVCAPISKEETHFDYGIGMVYTGGSIPDGFRVWDVTPTLWAVFKCIGKDGKCIGETWDRIFKEFLPGCEYNMLDDTDFELYSENGEPDCFCEIWVPVEKK